MGNNFFKVILHQTQKDISGFETLSYPAKEAALKKSNNAGKGEVGEYRDG